MKCIKSFHHHKQRGGYNENQLQQKAWRKRMINKNVVMGAKTKPWGPLSGDEVEELKKAPAMKGAEIIRRHDPAYGYRGKKNYNVLITRKTIEVEEAIYKVCANSTKEAEKIAKADSGNWHKLKFKRLRNEDEEYVDYVEVSDDL